MFVRVFLINIGGHFSKDVNQNFSIGVCISYFYLCMQVLLSNQHIT